MITQSRRAGLSLALFIFLIDQISKYIVTVPLQLEAVGQITLLPIFNLTWVENYGVSLGFLTADSELGRWLLVLMTGTISAGVAWWLWRETNRQDVLGLGLILGGALGNMLDRVRLGHVVDFADLHFGDVRPFLVFNVADTAITIGVLVLLARALFGKDKASTAKVETDNA
ncbi:MAG: signal peptidase II [Sphingomonadaceae bacterium]